MEAVHLDTHVVVWLFNSDQSLDLLSKRARAAIEEATELLVSPAVLLELALLRETGRITAGAQEVLVALQGTIGLDLADESFTVVATEAARLAWTRDPFDRLIAAQAKTGGASLVTRDRTIRANMKTAIW
ncbi:MAG: type II toxin-antitoxin system VapC family toxin [Gemmatimonadota bacterium]